jgi:hypothetical protein
MLRLYKKYIFFSSILIICSCILNSSADDEILAEVEVREQFGITRNIEYVVCSVQLPYRIYQDSQLTITAIDNKTFKKIPCQVFNRHNYEEQNVVLLNIIFPISLEAFKKNTYQLIKDTDTDVELSDLSYRGNDLDLVVENEFYIANLTKSGESEAKSHNSGQLRELQIKMGQDIRLFRTENRMHWAPNFQNSVYDEYETIAGWENPTTYEFHSGPYLIHTLRCDFAPKHPEIMLTSSYYFYSGLPYFRFQSSMEVEKDLSLRLLRNDEMTMDSLFTHVAFQRPDGQIEDLSFAERYERLEENPIENHASWLCFYHNEDGYAFGSIRIKYDIKNSIGQDSPTYLPHTKISDGAGGGKYWNRRLIHDYPLVVPKGSRYIEENAYLVFKIGNEDKFKEIKYWADRVRHPLDVKIEYE